MVATEDQGRGEETPVATDKSGSISNQETVHPSPTENSQFFVKYKLNCLVWFINNQLHIANVVLSSFNEQNSFLDCLKSTMISAFILDLNTIISQLI